MILRHLFRVPPRLAALMFGVVLVAVAAMLLSTGATPTEATHAGTVKPNPQTGYIIQGHKFNVKIDFTTCTTTTSSTCRLGAYKMRVAWDPVKHALVTSSGTSTGFNTSTTFNDTTKAWKVNQWAGSRVFLTSGAGYIGCNSEPQSRMVVSNTATQLVISPAWDSCLGVYVPNNFTTYELGGITDGGWITSTGRPVICDTGQYPPGNYESNWAELECISLGSTPLGPTGTGTLVNLTLSAEVRGLPAPISLLTPQSQVLRIDGINIAADLTNGTRRVILCPDPTGEGTVNVIDLLQIAQSMNTSVTPPHPKDPTEDGAVNVIDLNVTAGVFNKKCVQP